MLDVGFGATLCLYAAEIHLLLKDLHLGSNRKKMTKAFLEASRPTMTELGLRLGTQLFRFLDEQMTVSTPQEYSAPCHFLCRSSSKSTRCDLNMTAFRKSHSAGLTFPPPGWCLMFSVEPILDLTFFRSGMGATGATAMGARDLREPGDLGGVRTTATFFTCCPGVLDLLAGDLGVAGLLQPLRSGVFGESAAERPRKIVMLNTSLNAFHSL